MQNISSPGPTSDILGDHLLPPHLLFPLLPPQLLLLSLLHRPHLEISKITTNIKVATAHQTNVRAAPWNRANLIHGLKYQLCILRLCVPSD